MNFVPFGKFSFKVSVWLHGFVKTPHKFIIADFRDNPRSSSVLISELPTRTHDYILLTHLHKKVINVPWKVG